MTHNDTHKHSYCILPFIGRFKSRKVLSRDEYLVFKTISKTKEMMASKV